MYVKNRQVLINFIVIVIVDTLISASNYSQMVNLKYANKDYDKSDNTEVEKTHLKFCKLYLGVNRKASYIACRGELGKFPLLISIKKNIINYIKYIFKLHDTSFVYCGGLQGTPHKITRYTIK